MGWRGRGPSCVPLPLHPQPSPCWPAVGTAVGSTQENQHPLNRPLPRPLTCCPPTALPLLPPIHSSTTSGPSCEQAEGRSPLGRGPYQRGSEAGFFPIPFITSPHPYFITQGCSPPPTLLLPWGSRVGEGKKFKSVEVGVGLEGAQRQMDHRAAPPCVAGFPAAHRGLKLPPRLSVHPGHSEPGPTASGVGWGSMWKKDHQRAARRQKLG